MELYKKEKINPLAGCLPIVIQIPVFFSLYKVLFVTIEMRHAPFFGWIKDLSAPDPTNIFNLFGLIPFDPTLCRWSGSSCMLGVWPLIMGITMWVADEAQPGAARPDAEDDLRLDAADLHLHAGELLGRPGDLLGLEQHAVGACSRASSCASTAPRSSCSTMSKACSARSRTARRSAASTAHHPRLSCPAKAGHPVSRERLLDRRPARAMTGHGSTPAALRIAHEVALADFNAALADDVVGGGGVKPKFGRHCRATGSGR